MKTIIISLLLTLLRSTLCRASPLQPGEASIAAETLEPFAGSVTSCRMPNSSYCGISYRVPDSIATLVHLIEGEIAGFIENYSVERDNACRALQKEILCAQKFPRCVDDSVQLTSTANCASKVREECGSDASTVLETRLCELEDETIRMDTCSPISDYKRGNNFSHCEVLGNEVRVTEWMFRLISYTDSLLEQSFNSATLLNHGSCPTRYALYSCQLLGECTEDGSKISIKSDYHSCESTVTW